MKTTDIIQRFIFKDAHIRGQIVNLSHSFKTITTQHGYPYYLHKILGEALLVSCLISSTIKLTGRVTVQFQGKEALKLMVAQCTDDFKLRGLIQWDGEISKESISKALEHGTLAIMLSQDNSLTPYQGIVEWNKDLVHSIEVYFRDSEQVSTRLWLAVNEHTASGLLLQKMPPNTSSSTTRDTDDWERIVCLSETITQAELLTLDQQTILHRLYSQENIEIFPAKQITFACTCSQERSKNAIALLSQEELKQELNEQNNITVTCEFCNQSYIFDPVDIAKIKKDNEQSSGTLH